MNDKRILVVDDEQPLRELLQEALTQKGWNVDTAADGAEALQLVNDNLYDAAVLDFVLPDTDGLTLHGKIRRIDEELAARTLFISGEEQAETSLEYFGSDGAGFLAKPFNVSEVVNRLRKLLD